VPLRVPCTRPVSPADSGPSELSRPERLRWSEESQSSVALPQHADQHIPKRPVLLAVHQQLGEGAGLWIPQNSPIRSARSKSGSMRTWRSSARGAGPKARGGHGVGVRAHRDASWRGYPLGAHLDRRPAVPGGWSAWGVVRVVSKVNWELKHAVPVTARRRIEAAESPSTIGKSGIGASFEEPASATGRQGLFV